MFRKTTLFIFGILLTCLLAISPSNACTSLLVTKSASADGSTFITYTCDGRFHPHLWINHPEDYPVGDSLKIEDWHGNVRGWIKQAEHIYGGVGMMNEFQLAISETTFDGRPELENKEGILGYWDLIDLALQRATTAREAIRVMTDLVAEYGYNSTGETFSIADPKEVWIMEMIGMGEGRKGAVWVALKIPDGYISAHANKARIATFPLNDSDNCLYSENVITFAVEMGYYNPASGQPFSFCKAYCPPDPKNRRYADTRVWSLFRRAAPSMDLSPDISRSVEGAHDYPLWIKPDKKLSLEDILALMRDHYEGTPYDMTAGVAAGPYGTPYRWRPLYWTLANENGDSVEYSWERPISTQQTGFTSIAQCRAWLPDPIGGVYWYGVDDTWFTCYIPLYAGIDTVPRSFTVGSINKFSWESAWWVFNFVSNFTNLRYQYMIQDVQKVQRELEGNALTMQAAVEKAALETYKKDPATARRFLTDYCISNAETVVRRWRELGEDLIVKYNDGYIIKEDGRAEGIGYPENWLKTVVEQDPEKYKLPVSADSTVEMRLID
jgi:dipeptidase